jgi:hypothetical protein
MQSESLLTYDVDLLMAKGESHGQHEEHDTPHGQAVG